MGRAGVEDLVVCRGVDGFWRWQATTGHGLEMSGPFGCGRDVPPDVSGKYEAARDAVRRFPGVAPRSARGRSTRACKRLEDFLERALMRPGVLELDDAEAEDFAEAFRAWSSAENRAVYRLTAGGVS